MKLLTKKTDYAVRALVFLAENPAEYVSSSAMHKQLGIPVMFLRQIQRTLIAEGILDAKEGAGGGVKLVRPPEKIYLSSIIELFQGKVQLSECMFRRRICPNRAACLLRRKINGIENTVLKEFNKITVRSLMTS